MDLLAAVLSFFSRKPKSNGHGAEETDASAPKPTVLVIDDDPKFLETMQILLRGAGYNVLTSSTGPKGLDMIRYAQRVRTVLLDFNMPGFDGAETLQYLRKLNPNVRVIAVSGFRVSDLPASFQKGVNRFLAKPFSNGELLATIAEELGLPASAEISSASV